MRCRRATALTGVALTILGVAACGPASTGEVIARVGGSPITRAAVEHQISIIAGGRPMGAPTEHEHILEQQALAALVTTYWVIGEAADRGLGPSDAEVRQRLQARDAASFPGGEGELRAYLQTAGQTMADREREARVELASEKLDAAILRAVPAVTRLQAVRYYHANRARFAVPPRRVVLITNRKTAAAAEKLKIGAAGGGGFASLSRPETVALPCPPGHGYARRVLDRAISLARVNVLSGPVKERVDYFVFEVKRVLPAGHRSFAQVKEGIVRQLVDASRRRALATFTAAWSSKWRARTTCSAGYVVEGCREYHGQGRPAARVVRVGQAQITKASVAHWMAVLAPEHMVPDPPRYAVCVAHRRRLTPTTASNALEAACRQEHRALEQRALDLLISAQWLIGEAADDGVGVSRQEIRRQLEQNDRAFASEGTGIAEALAATGQTLADVELEIRAERAAAKLRRMLTHREPVVTSANIAAYYRRHIHRFTLRERRYFYIVEALRTRGMAMMRMREIRHGRSIASFSLHESLERSTRYLSAPSVVKAIFTARPGVLVGPIAVSPSLYYVIEVDRIRPAMVETLSDARWVIDTQLRRERQRRTLDSFVRAATAKWITRTRCEPGIVVAKCEQYTGRRAPSDAFDLAWRGSATGAS